MTIRAKNFSPAIKNEILARDHLEEQAFLVACGVRALALLNVAPENSIRGNLRILRGVIRDLRLEKKVLPFAHRKGPPDLKWLQVGFVRNKAMLDLYCWVNSGQVPDNQRRKIQGLLFGYSPDEIAEFDERASRGDRNVPR